MKRWIQVALAAMIFSAHGLYAQTQTKPTVLIIPFDMAMKNESFDSLKTGIPDLLTAFLTPHEEKLMVIDRGLMESVFTEKSLSWEGFKEEKTYSQLGQLSQARYIIKGSVNGDDQSLTIHAFLYDTESTRLIKAFECSTVPSGINQAIQQLALEIAQYFRIKAAEVKDLPVEEDPEKSLNLIYGLGYYHNGRFEKALGYFMKILEDHPQDEIGNFWMGKSFLAAGMSDHAEMVFEKYLKDFPGSQKVAEVRKFLKTIHNKKEAQNDTEKNTKE